MSQGYTEALLGMAGWHMTGADSLLPQNQGMAFELVYQAAERGLARAQYTLGYFFEGGIGTRIDLNMAARFYSLAAEQGEERAINRLRRDTNPAPLELVKKKRSLGFFSFLKK